MLNLREDPLPMIYDGPAFLDLLATVPDLLPACLGSWESRSAGMRVLRLVGKDASVPVLRDVTSFSVQLGMQASPSPWDMVRLLSGVKLQNLKFTIVTLSGMLQLFKLASANHIDNCPPRLTQ